jgi:hypothetical protein
LRKINGIQKDIAEKRVSFEGTDDLGESEFIMFENMFQIEEKLKSVFHQLQKMTSTAKERVSPEAIRSQRNFALLKTLTDECPPTRDPMHIHKEVILPPVIKQSLDRVTSKDTDHPMNTSQSALQSAERTPKAEHNTVRSSPMTKRPTLLRSQHTKGRSMLPVRDESIALREFASKEFSSQPSKLPLPKSKIENKKHQGSPKKKSKLPLPKRSKIPLPKLSKSPLPKIKVAKQQSSQQKTKFITSNIGAMHSFSLNSGQEFTATVKLPHTVVGPLSHVEGGSFPPLPHVEGGSFPPLPHVEGGSFPPLPPVGGRGVRTSTNLRRKHFALQKVLIH